MEPFDDAFAAIGQMPESQWALPGCPVHFAAINLCRDLRGVCACPSPLPSLSSHNHTMQCDAGLCVSAGNPRSYGLLFDWLYPRYFPLLLRLLDVFSSPAAAQSCPVCSDVIISILRFLRFDCSPLYSPSLIRLSIHSNPSFRLYWIVLDCVGLCCVVQGDGDEQDDAYNVRGLLPQRLPPLPRDC